MTDILMIEDNEELGMLIRDFLKREGFTVEWKLSAEEGLMSIRNSSYKLLLLDVMLPGMDGYEALAKIRESYNLPVLMMSAKTDDDSKILGLDVGADDYIDKPFSIPVLSHKIKALMRRSYPSSDSDQGPTKLTYGDIEIDTSSRTVTKGGQIVATNVKEYELLVYFLSHAEQVIPKETLFDAVWGSDCLSEMSTLNVYINRLRDKFEADPKNPELIRTVWRVGFKFGGAAES